MNVRNDAVSQVLFFLIGVMHSVALRVYSQNERLYFDSIDRLKKQF